MREARELLVHQLRSGAHVAQVVAHARRGVQHQAIKNDIAAVGMVGAATALILQPAQSRRGRGGQRALDFAVFGPIAEFQRDEPENAQRFRRVHNAAHRPETNQVTCAQTQSLIATTLIHERRRQTTYSCTFIIPPIRGHGSARKGHGCHSCRRRRLVDLCCCYRCLRLSLSLVLASARF